MAITREAIMAQLEKVIDPELHRNIVELGFVKKIEIDGGKVDLEIHLTIMGCPLKGPIEEDIKRNVGSVPGVTSVNVVFGAMTDEERARVAQMVRGGAHAQAQKRESVLLQPTSKTRIIGVGSGKGGVGKSTATVNLAAALSKLGYKVGVLDADIYGFSVPRMLGKLDRPVVLDEHTILPLENHGIKFISAGSLVDETTPIVWRGPMLGKMIEQFMTDVHWGDIDYLLLDLPPGTGDVALSVAQMMPGTDMVIVTTPQAAAVNVAQRVAVMCQKTNQRVLGIIENMAYFICDGCEKEHEIFGKGGAQQFAEGLGVEVMGRVPLVGDVRFGGDVGTPVVLEEPESPAAQAFLEAARKLAAAAPPKKPAEPLPMI